MHVNFFSLITLLCALNVCRAHNILMTLVSGTKSHSHFASGIMEALLENNHKITFVSSHNIALESPRLRKVVLKENVLEKFIKNAFKMNALSIMEMLIKHTPMACPQDLNKTEVQEVINDNYDMIMVPMFFGDCYLSVVHKLKVPFVFYAPNSLMDPYSDQIGSPEFYSVSPMKFLPFTYPMSFKERMITTLFSSIYSILHKYMIVDRADKICREFNLCGPDMPHIRELQGQASLTIINSVRTLEVPVKLTPPTVIYAGGIHIKANKSLPQDLQQWIDESGENGLIYFSLGTGAKSAHMKKEHVEVLINVFRSLKQRVLWKWDSTDIQNLPSNIKIMSWLPQQDILAHPKTRLFITHGGLLSIQEATYFGVPVIGMPVFGDQTMNIADVVNEGWGRAMKWDELAEEKLRNLIIDILKDKEIQRRVQLRSKIMKDQPQSPAQLVVYWIEYVIRHKGATHLRSPFVSMYWYQIYNLDVWAFIIFVFVCVLLILYDIVKGIASFCKKKLFKRKKE